MALPAQYFAVPAEVWAHRGPGTHFRPEKSEWIFCVTTN